MPADTLILILAIGRGIGLDPLTEHRTKAAVPFGGKYRIIDFTLANCLHSGLRQVLVVTQYKSHSLHKHLRDGWSIFNPELGEFITPVPPQMRESQAWYSGPFDAIRQNRYLLERSRARQILVLDGAAVYRMDYAELVRAHRQAQANVTLAVRTIGSPGTRIAATAFVEVDAEDRVSRLLVAPPRQPEEGVEQLQAMGVYLFDKDWLLHELEQPRHCGVTDDRDLALDCLAPQAAMTHILAYRFGQQRGRVTPDRYWCDLASIDAYYQANMALLRAESPLDLYQPDWTIHTYQGQYPPARTIPGPITGNEGVFVNSMLAAGTVIGGGGVNHSILFPRVRVHDGAIVEASILFDGVVVGAGAQLHACIVEKEVEIPPNARIGFDARLDRERFRVSDDGVVVVTKGCRLA